jgi:3'-5' exoribonuclease
MKNVFVRDIRQGDKVSEVFLAAEKNLAFSQKGAPYLSLKLKDRTGEVDGKVWDHAPEWDQAFKKGDFVQVNARAVSYRDAVQLNILGIKKLEETDVDPMDFLPACEGDPEEMFAELMGFVNRVTTPHLKALLTAFFRDEALVGRFKRAPAAKSFHHNTIGGLLEHTLSVTRLLDRAADHYPGANRDLLITGGILHDIGKVHEFSYDRMVEYTDAGRLVGHIVMGVEMLDTRLAGLPDFPEQTAMALRHLILSHHGVLEFGSPKRPKTLEALIVHHMDDLDAKVNALQTFIEASPEEDSDWTPYHRLLERYIYKG